MCIYLQTSLRGGGGLIINSMLVCLFGSLFAHNK